MLYTFTCAATADVLMMDKPARQILAILGKDPADAKGIVTVAQLPEAIARLRAAIEEDRALQAERERQRSEDEEDQEDADNREAGRTGMAAPVGLAQRAWPLLDMLEYAQKEEVPVIWGT